MIHDQTAKKYKRIYQTFMKQANLYTYHNFFPIVHFIDSIIHLIVTYIQHNKHKLPVLPKFYYCMLKNSN